MVFSVQKILINSLLLMSKGEEKQQRASIRQSEEEYCHASIRQSEEEYFHQCQRGIFLEILSLMAKDVAKELPSKCSREEHRKSAFTESSISQGEN